jgi:predicted MFS family arabinose efflux permease
MEAVLSPGVTRNADKTARREVPAAARFAVAALFFMNGVLFASWVSRIPALQAERALNHAQLGLALLLIALGALVAMPVAGWSAARFGSRRVTQVSAALYCIVLPLLACETGRALFSLVLLCFGAAHGAFDVAMNAQAVVVEERYERPIMSSFHALFSVGGLVGAALGAVIASAKVVPFAHFSGVALLLGIAVAFFAFPRPIDTGRPQPAKSWSESKPRSKFSLPPKTLVALGSLAFCVMMGEGAMADWSAVFLRRFAGTDEGVAAAGYAAFSIAMAAGRFSGDWLSARLGAVTLVRLSGALSVAGLSLALFFPQAVPALIGFAAVGAGFAAVVPQVFSAAGNTPGLSSEAALATTTTIGYAGFLIGPPLIGFVAEAIGLRGALGIVVGMSALMIVLAPSVQRRRH